MSCKALGLLTRSLSSLRADLHAWYSLTIEDLCEWIHNLPFVRMIQSILEASGFDCHSPTPTPHLHRNKVTSRPVLQCTSLTLTSKTVERIFFRMKHSSYHKANVYCLLQHHSPCGYTKNVSTAQLSFSRMKALSWRGWAGMELWLHSSIGLKHHGGAAGSLIYMVTSWPHCQNIMIVKTAHFDRWLRGSISRELFPVIFFQFECNQQTHTTGKSLSLCISLTHFLSLFLRIWKNEEQFSISCLKN